MTDRAAIQKLFMSHGCREFRWIDPAEIVVAQWVRMRCTFNCDSYGRNAACPPNTPPIAECSEFFKEYRLGTVFRFASTSSDLDERHAWTRKVNLELLALEREVLLAGCHKAFLLFLDSCNFCKECAKTRSACRNKKMARPSPEGMGVDVLATAARFGFPADAISEDGTAVSRFAFLLLE